MCVHGCTWYVSMFVCISLGKHVPWHMCGGQRTRVGVFTFYLVWDRVSYFAAMKVKLAGSQASGDSPVLAPTLPQEQWGYRCTLCLPFRWLLWIHTQVLTVARQALAKTFPDPSLCFTGLLVKVKSHNSIISMIKQVINIKLPHSDDVLVHTYDVAKRL